MRARNVDNDCKSMENIPSLSSNDDMIGTKTHFVAERHSSQQTQ